MRELRRKFGEIPAKQHTMSSTRVSKVGSKTQRLSAARLPKTQNTIVRETRSLCRLCLQYCRKNNTQCLDCRPDTNINTPCLDCRPDTKTCSQLEEDEVPPSIANTSSSSCRLSAWPSLTQGTDKNIATWKALITLAVHALPARSARVLSATMFCSWDQQAMAAVCFCQGKPWSVRSSRPMRGLQISVVPGRRRRQRVMEGSTVQQTILSALRALIFVRRDRCMFCDVSTLIPEPETAK